MKNIAVPGVFPFAIALMLGMIAIRAHVIGKQSSDKRYRTSKVVSAAGALIFLLIALFQVLESSGIVFR